MTRLSLNYGEIMKVVAVIQVKTDSIVIPHQVQHDGNEAIVRFYMYGATWRI
jgi:hypothetical protein